MQLKKYLVTILVVSWPGSTQNAANSPAALPAGPGFLAHNSAATYAVSSYNWSRTDSWGSVGNLTTAGAAKTLTLTPCPLGVDVSNNPSAPYGIYIAGTGTAEAVPVIGGTCKSGAASGTVVITTKNAHPAGFTVGSASGGNQEAINVASNNGGPFAMIQEVPAGSETANYNIYWPVFLNSSKTTLVGDGAFWQCYTRAVCLLTTNYAGSSQGHNVIRGLTFQPAVNVEGAQITSASAFNGVYTVTTTSGHHLQAGDWVILFYSTPASDQEARVQVLSTGLTATQFQYCNKIVSYNPTVCSGRGPTFSMSYGFGWVALEDAAIEVESDGTKLVDIRFQGPTVVGARFHQGVVVGNDQDFVVDGMTVLDGTVFRATANFVGNVLYFRGDNGAAAVPYIHHLEASMQCGGNGIRNLAGNTMDVTDSVIQGTSQYSIYYANGLNPWQINNVYHETGSCTNPFYTAGSYTAEAGFISNSDTAFTVQGNAPIGGAFPSFATGGGASSQRNYFVVAHDSNKGISPMLFIGTAQPVTRGTNIPLYWPNLDLSGSRTRTWDIIVNLGSNPSSAPYTGNAFSVATGITATCGTTGICTYTDTQAATSTYTVTPLTWSPPLWFWPGSIILGKAGTAYVGIAGQASAIVSTTYLPSVFAKRCPDLGRNYFYSPVWISCPAGDSIGNANPNVGSYVMQVGAATFMPTGVTGVLNFNPGPNSTVHPRQIVTTFDGNPQQTFATPGYVRPGSAADSYIGTDTVGRVGTQDQIYGAPGGHNFYVKDKGTSGKTWALHIGASGPQLKRSTYSDLNAATPCSSNTEGSMAAVTDSNTSTWGATISGGGSSHVLAYCDGTHWTVEAN